MMFRNTKYRDVKISSLNMDYCLAQRLDFEFKNYQRGCLSVLVFIHYLSLLD